MGFLGGGRCDGEHDALAGGMPRLLGSMLGIGEIPDDLGARIHEATLIPEQPPSQP